MKTTSLSHQNPRCTRRLHVVPVWLACRSTWAALSGVLALLLITPGCQQPATSFPPAPGAAVPAPYTSSLLTEGDTIRVAFEGDTNMTTVAKIQLDGTITLPLVGNVKATGLTPAQLRANLMALYKNLLSVNEVTVTLVSASASVYVSGAVLKPGRIPLDRPLTALEAIMEAGGFDQRRARINAVSIIRNENGQQQHFTLNLKNALSGLDPTPFYLKPYDIIYVPEKTITF